MRLLECECRLNLVGPIASDCEHRVHRGIARVRFEPISRQTKRTCLEGRGDYIATLSIQADEMCLRKDLEQDFSSINADERLVAPACLAISLQVRLKDLLGDTATDLNGVGLPRLDVSRAFSCYRDSKVNSI